MSDELTLREIDLTDTGFIVGCRSNPDVYRFFKSPHKITEQEHINWFNDSYLKDDSKRSWIILGSEGNRMGVVGAALEDDNSAEISYILSPEYYGHGYATEAVTKVIAFCKEEWNCSKVIAEIHKDNQASINLVTRLGFTLSSSDKDFVIYSRSL
ncbi:MAG: GNAT family N-acetyltransferase [Clostridiales bacterium]|nr:GNAT family N-acetyltransferase [Clostridiales bacterium]